MAEDRIVKLLVIGGSAGSLEVLLQLLPRLRADLRFPVLVVVHRKSSESVLPELLADRTPLPVKEAEDKEPMHPGTIYIAPADYHTLVESDGTLSLDCSEKVNWSRPSIDVTFETAADVYGAGVTGLLLSGANHDGVEGLRRIQAHGGAIWAQDPSTAQIAYMPQGALDALQLDAVLTPDALVDAVNAL
ncbi:MAG: chemotaxis protein CheB [Chitinophagaceae bacterium]|nr:MAG: chemotaxis protein CheB [Chitinophagaceae bacterium]